MLNLEDTRTKLSTTDKFCPSMIVAEAVLSVKSFYRDHALECHILLPFSERAPPGSRGRRISNQINNQINKQQQNSKNPFAKYNKNETNILPSPDELEANDSSNFWVERSAMAATGI